MASEYLTRKAKREVPSPETPAVYTKKEKALNWLYYHWYWFLIGAVLLWITGSMLVNALGIGRIRPDYIFAYMGKEPLSEDQAERFETALAPLGSDLNGDGRTAVELRQYITRRGGDPETALYYNQAADAKLIADITRGESYFFLTDDPEQLQRSYQILANADGTAPDDRDYGAEGKVVKWGDCPALRDLPLDGDVFRSLYLGRRYFASSEADGHTGEAMFWETLTKGAIQ